ncbi:kinectin isoform X11 [Pan paniscus]|uniref:Kinectin 1 n=2 Tax=Pan TaxID=9596 RepID=A0A2I3TV89_PANTR|nr:kinectin isoform X11 [Pan troglodytes]XP_024204502.2 kinectin isoform X11 [Pan troglodytes]XP_034793498.2 kinectin isoform X11 [Pan paniscus]XP_034793499.2 kinectin isoform X11 [Pan paniscus]XP_054522561.1 kinectin isoform X11 [Pan troglodytes]XP_054522562.1 kinectin isoform X11 [Pan troglodytes]XP_054522563.1 kinectin isoform X11 [Pan troglodytes]XP_054522564.1 kinectin isoform X11 [Pan troglodytes]XP_054522565.1 kinectin isoform X12 [Pan troglodytes]XP_054953603.1 kinectin isoform X11
MEFYESAYFIVLIPSIVITVIFLFFWLFMKETLYDEVLAKQKREQKLIPTKTDKKKAEKKKNKKKEIQNGNLHESDSESVPRDFKLSDALAVEDDQVVPVPLNVVETSSSVRERKKKEKKQKPVLEEQVIKESDASKIPGKKVEPVPVTKQPTPPSEAAASKKKPGQKKSKNGSDDQDKKVETLMVPSKRQEALPLHQETKQESGSGKKKASSKKPKTENVYVDEPLIHATTYIPLMDNADSSPVVDKREVIDLLKPDQVEGIQKSGTKKLKTETDKENAEVKFKDFLLSLKTMMFSEDEALCVVDLLKEKSGVIQDALKKSSKGELTTLIHQLQEKDKLLAAVKEDAAATKDRCKQLTQEMMTEKERSNVVITRMKDRIGTLEKEHNVFQNKIHVSYQETQQMQMKFQQVREQMEAEIAHLKQENGILRDAVSNTTNQLESKQSAELNKLRQDYARLVNELTEKTGKLQQEEVQKKNAEQAATQLKVQLQEAERRWEEVQSYIRKRTAEHEAAQQDLQSKFVAKENEVQSLHSKLTDTLVSKQQLEQRLMQLMESEQKRVNKEESLQMQVQDILEQNEALKAQIQQFHSQIAAQTSASVLAEELHKVIAEKDKQIKQTEDSLASERDHLTSKEEELKDIQNMNFLLKAEVQKLQALANEQAAAAHELEKMQQSVYVKDDKIRLLEEQLQHEISNKMEEFKILNDQNKALKSEVQKLQTLVSEQPNKDVVEQMEKCIQEKDEKLKTVEELLETGLIQVATKEEELNAIRTENSSLTKEVQDLKAKQNDQVSFASLVEELKKVIHEKDGKIKSVEELLEAELLKVANKEKTVQDLKQEIKALKEEIGNVQLEKAQQLSITSKVQELQNLLKGKEEQMNTMKAVLEEKEKDLANTGKWLQDLQEENESLKAHVQEVAQHNLKEASSASQFEELEIVLKEKENELKRLEATLKERESDLSSKTKLLQDVQDENKLFKSQIEELKQQNHQQASSFPPHEELLKVISEREKEISGLWNELDSLKDAVEHQRKKNNERQQQVEAVELEAKEVLKKLFPKVSVPSNLSYSEWLHGFEKKAKECMAGTSGSEEVKVLEHKLKEADEMHTLLQLECEKYKSVLAETEGILQKLQRSVEQEENKWKVKVDESHKTIKQMQSSFTSSEQELERLRSENKDIENLRREREHLEMELEKAEMERSTYVTEVRELKAQLNETLTKLRTEQNERQKVAGDLHKAQQSLELIQSKIVKAAGDTTVIENSDVSPETESSEKETMSVSLNQTVTQLQQLLQAVNQQLTKEKEHYQVLE